MTTTTQRETALSFAQQVIEHIRGTDYGQKGNHPVDDRLSEQVQSFIWRLVADGHRAAIARSEHDEARAAMCRETVPRLRRMIPADVGLTADECFSIGYKAFGCRT